MCPEITQNKRFSRVETVANRYRSYGNRAVCRPGKRSAAGQDDGSVAKEPVAAVDQRCQHGEERRIFQRIAKMVGAQRQMGG